MDICTRTRLLNDSAWLFFYEMQEAGDNGGASDRADNLSFDAVEMEVSDS
jgi:hypothetical protein